MLYDYRSDEVDLMKGCYASTMTKVQKSQENIARKLLGPVTGIIGKSMK